MVSSARSPACRLLALLVICTWSVNARAAPRGEEDDEAATRVDAWEVAAPRAPNDPVGHPAPLWMAIQATVVRYDDGRRDLGAMMLLGIPLGRISQSAAKEPPSLDPPERSSKQQGAGAPKPPPLDPKLAPTAPDARRAELPIPVMVTAEVARGAIRAALRRAHLSDPEARLDALVARASRAALLPELRLRAMRLVDEGQSLTPTEYDPQHTSAVNGTSFWLEARATWRLDRLVFTEEEVAVERMRYERTEAQERLASHILEQLFAWQKARAQEESPTASPEEHLAASLKVLETETAIDVATDGWFARWRARDALRPAVTPAK